MIDTNITLIVVGMILGVAIGWMIGKINIDSKLRSARKQAINTSRHVHKGYTSEKLAPLLPIFPYNPRDMVFVGKGFDYLVIKGLSKQDITEIIFLEIKSAKSNLNTNERLIKQAIDAKQVRYEVWKM